MDKTHKKRFILRVRHNQESNTEVSQHETIKESSEYVSQQVSIASAREEAIHIRVIDLEKSVIGLEMHISGKTVYAQQRFCHSCGCSDEDACNPPCYWVAENLCSACRDKKIKEKENA